MAEQMTEEQILGAFMQHSPGLSEEQPPEQQQEAAPEQQPAPEQQLETKAQEQQEDAQTIEIDPEEALFEQEVEEGGKKSTQKLSLKELQLGYMRQSDYTRKATDVARQRDEIPSMIAKHVQEVAGNYGKRLSELESLVMKAVLADFQNVDLDKLVDEDPFQYNRYRHRLEKTHQLLHTIQQEKKAADDKLGEENKKNKAERWSKSVEILSRDIPGFGPDAAKRVAEMGEQYGFSASEVGQWDDHRVIKMAYDLAEKKSVEAKRPEVEKKVALVTKVLKPGAKTAARSPLDEAKTKLRKSGRPEDALPIFQAMLR